MAHLSPDRTRQGDFFIADICEAAPKDDTASMEHPLFALRAGDHRVRIYLSRLHYGYADKATAKAEQHLSRERPEWAARVPQARAIAGMTGQLMTAVDLYQRGKLQDVHPALAKVLNAVPEMGRTRAEREQKLRQVFSDPAQREGMAALLRPHTRQLQRGLDRGVER